MKIFDDEPEERDLCPDCNGEGSRDPEESDVIYEECETCMGTGLRRPA